MSIEETDTQEELDWIPNHFRRESVEESARAMLDSYKELQGAFTRVSQEKAALESNFTDLAAQLQADQLGVEPDYLGAAGDPASAYVEDAIADLPALPEDQLTEAVNSHDARALVQQIAAQTTHALLAQTAAQVGLVPTPQAQGDALFAQVDQQLSATYPDWQERKQRVGQEIQSTPALVDAMNSALVAGDAARVASVLTIAATSVDHREDLGQLAHKMKLNAQTAPGAGSRPDPISDESAAWAAIRDAGMGSYSDRFRRP